MSRYLIELRQQSYLHVTVEADSQHEAHCRALAGFGGLSLERLKSSLRASWSLPARCDMVDRRKRAKGAGTHGAFAALPHIILDHPDFHALSGAGLKVLLHLLRQYKPGKNGDLSASFSDMKPKGVRSQTTLAKAIAELIDTRWIIRTREGRFLNPGGRCALYALSWHPIDECPGKDLEVMPTSTAPRKLTLERCKMPSLETGANGSRKWSDRACGLLQYLETLLVYQGVEALNLECSLLEHLARPFLGTQESTHQQMISR